MAGAIVETARLWLRAWEPDDWIAFRRLSGDPRVMRFINTGEPWLDERNQEFAGRQIRQQETLGYSMWKLVPKHTGDLSGFCGLQPLPATEETEIGWWLIPELWGQGLATEAAQAVLTYGFERAGLSRIVAVAQPANRASTRVMEKIGMAFEKPTVHRGIDVVMYAVNRPGRA
ncbi:MAG: GNAT family N-acetyltransferase [Bryobacteraceae bacterium]